MKDGFNPLKRGFTAKFICKPVLNQMVSMVLRSSGNSHELTPRCTQTITSKAEFSEQLV